MMLGNHLIWKYAFIFYGGREIKWWIDCTPRTPGNIFTAQVCSQLALHQHFLCNSLFIHKPTTFVLQNMSYETDSRGLNICYYHKNCSETMKMLLQFLLWLSTCSKAKIRTTMCPVWASAVIPTRRLLYTKQLRNSCKSWPEVGAGLCCVMVHVLCGCRINPVAGWYWRSL